MFLTELVGRLRRASRHPPGYLAKRVVEIAARRLDRPWSNVYPHLLTPRAVAMKAGAPSVDALWDSQQRAAFFVAPAGRETTIASFRQRYPNAAPRIVEAADEICRHEFDLL